MCSWICSSMSQDVRLDQPSAQSNSNFSFRFDVNKFWKTKCYIRKEDEHFSFREDISRYCQPEEQALKDSVCSGEWNFNSSIIFSLLIVPQHSWRSSYQCHIYQAFTMGVRTSNYHMKLFFFPGIKEQRSENLISLSLALV